MSVEQYAHLSSDSLCWWLCCCWNGSSLSECLVMGGRRAFGTPTHCWIHMFWRLAQFHVFAAQYMIRTRSPCVPAQHFTTEPCRCLKPRWKLALGSLNYGIGIALILIINRLRTAEEQPGVPQCALRNKWKTSGSSSSPQDKKLQGLAVFVR